METTTRIPTRGAPTSAERRLAVAQPQALPLPFDDGADEAVPFVLTAAAHREVLGRDAPPLVAVGGSGQPSSGQPSSGQPSSVGSGKAEAPGDGRSGEEVVDTRRVQARALLRSGMPVPTIAAALGTDAATVEGWTADLVDELARRRHRSERRAWQRRVASVAGSVPTSPVDPRSTERDRLIPGLAYAIAEVGEDGVAFVHDRVETVAMLLGALREELELADRRVRVAVRLSLDLPADRMRRELAERLGVDAATITVGRSGPGGRGNVELRVDVLDPAAARVVAGWCDADGSWLRGWDSNPQTFRLTADCSAS